MICHQNACLRLCHDLMQQIKKNFTEHRIHSGRCLIQHIQSAITGSRKTDLPLDLFPAWQIYIRCTKRHLKSFAIGKEPFFFIIFIEITKNSSIFFSVSVLKKKAVLWNDPDSFHCFCMLCLKIHSIKNHVPRIPAVLSSDQFKQCCFARSVFACYRIDVALPKLHRYICDLKSISLFFTGYMHQL